MTTNLPFGEWTKVFPDPGSPKPSSTGSPTARTSSTPAPSPGASATASPDARRPDPDRTGAHALSLLRLAYGSAPQRQRVTASPRPIRHYDHSNINHREVGPLLDRRGGAKRSRRSQRSACRGVGTGRRSPKARRRVDPRVQRVPRSTAAHVDLEDRWRWMAPVFCLARGWRDPQHDERRTGTGRARRGRLRRPTAEQPCQRCVVLVVPG